MNIREYVKGLFYRNMLNKDKAKLVELKYKVWEMKRGVQNGR